MNLFAEELDRSEFSRKTGQAARRASSGEYRNVCCSRQISLTQPFTARLAIEMSPQLACGAGISIKPGVKRSGTPGIRIVRNIVPAKRATDVALAKRTITAGCRPLRGLQFFCVIDPGAYAPGFMLTPASQALAHKRGVVSVTSGRDGTERPLGHQRLWP